MKPTPDTTLDPIELFKPSDDDIEGYEVVLLRGDRYKEKRDKEIEYLISGTPLDELMKLASPGWESGGVYELYGANGVGKTQFANTMAVLCDYDVIWIDGGEDTFRPERIMEIARLRGKDPEETIKRIHTVHPFNASHLEAVVAKLPKMLMRIKWEEVEVTKGRKKGEMEKQIVGREWINSRLTTGKVKLIVLDSLAPTFTLQYQGRERLAPRQQAIQRVIHHLRRMSAWFNCVTIVTNQIRDSPTGGGAFLPPWATQKPVGGNIVGHNIDFQILIRKGRGGVRIARIMDSSNTELGEIEFIITNAGVEPVED